MSALLEAANTFVLAAEPAPAVPTFTPTVPTEVSGATGSILGWTAGIGLSLATLGGLTGWACVAIGHNTERAGLAARGKQAILWSLISGGGIGVTASLVMLFYGLTKTG
ncbi:hypothetical protein [Streptomyces sp. NPDC048603]|uniref:hypothetical protein n=1 Tax=Streptomyces sp. NPDC048603 TaxID=3365577 RepID=UPI00371741D1